MTLGAPTRPAEARPRPALLLSSCHLSLKAARLITTHSPVQLGAKRWPGAQHWRGVCAAHGGVPGCRKAPQAGQWRHGGRSTHGGNVQCTAPALKAPLPEAGSLVGAQRPSLGQRVAGDIFRHHLFWKHQILLGRPRPCPGGARGEPGIWEEDK